MKDRDGALSPEDYREIKKRQKNNAAKELLANTNKVMIIRTPDYEGVMLEGDAGADYPIPDRDDTGRIVGPGMTMADLIAQFHSGNGGEQKTVGKSHTFYDN